MTFGSHAGHRPRGYRGGETLGRRFLFVLAILSVVSMGIAASALAGGTTIPSESQVLPAAQSLLTGLDPLITDTAVTDAQLATNGIAVDGPVSLVPDPNFVVDDDHAQCPNADFTSINAAVAAAPPGATIRVCPGTYKESVPILKPDLTLQAPEQQGQSTQCKRGAPDPTKDAIVVYNAALNGGNPSEGFDVEAPGVTIQGFTVQPDPTLVTHDGVGIFTSRFAAGYDIRHNVVQSNSIGIYVNSDGSAPTYVRENCARNNNLAGAAGGNGIYSDQGLSNATITNNYLTGDESNSIVVDTFLTTPHDIQITHNESVDDGSIATFASSGPPAYNLTVEHNDVIGSAGSGIVTFNVTTSSFSYNDVENGTFNGISLHETTNSTVSSNKANGFKLDGVRLGDSSNGNLVATNRAENNAVAGLQATEQSSGNTIRTNHMKGNHPDCSDQTVGGGTAGTANFWVNDFGFTEDHPGICKHAA